MENNSQAPEPAAPAKVTAPANEPPKTKQASSNHEVVPMAARTATMDRSAAPPQRGTAVGSVPVQLLPQPLSRDMFGTAQFSATMPPAAVGSLACRPEQQTNPYVFGQNSPSSNQAMRGLSSTQAVAVTALPAATHGSTAQYGAALRPTAFLPAPRRVRRRKLTIMRPPSPPPPKLPVYRPPAPPRPSLDTGFCVLNMQADPPSPDQEVTMAEEASDSEGGGSGDDVKMLDLNFPPVSDEEY